MKKLYLLILLLLSPLILAPTAYGANDADTNEDYTENDMTQSPDDSYKDYTYHDPWSGNMNFLIGERKVDDEDIESLGLDDLTTLGILIDIKEDTWPVSIAMDFYNSYESKYSTSNSFRTKLEVSELAFGVRKIIESTGGWRTFLGGGVSLVMTSMTIEDDLLLVNYKDEDTDIGYWVETGGYVSLSEKINLGFKVRYLDVDVALFDEVPASGLDWLAEEKDDDLSGVQFGAFIGTHF